MHDQIINLVAGALGIDATAIVTVSVGFYGVEALLRGGRDSGPQGVAWKPKAVHYDEINGFHKRRFKAEVDGISLVVYERFEVADV